MRTFKSRLKSIAWFLTALILLQSCVVYHKTPKTLEQASLENTDTKIWFSDDVQEFPWKYKYILLENGAYFGMEEIEKGELQKVPLEKEEIQRIRTKNKNASTWATIGICTLGLGAIIAIVAANFDISYGN